MQNQPHDGDKCQDPNCPLHGEGGVFEKLKAAGFKIAEGEGASSLAEALKPMFEKFQHAAQRDKIRDTICHTIDTVVRIEMGKLDGDRETKEQAMIEATSSLLAKSVAIYVAGTIATEYGLTPRELEENVDRLGVHFYEGFRDLAREMASGAIFAIGIERKAREAVEERKQARDATENN